MRYLTAIVLFLLVFPATASAGTTLILPNGQPAPKRFLSYIEQSKVQTPSVTIMLQRSGCPGVLESGGCTAHGWSQIYITHSSWDDQFSFMHELGHNFDFGMPHAARLAFAKILNDHRAWYEGEADALLMSSNAPLVEQFADYYASCAIDGSAPVTITQHHRDYVATEGYAKAPITVRQYKQICRLISRVGYVGASDPHVYDDAFSSDPIWPA